MLPHKVSVLRNTGLICSYYPQSHRNDYSAHILTTNRLGESIVRWFYSADGVIYLQNMELSETFLIGFISTCVVLSILLIVIYVWANHEKTPKTVKKIVGKEESDSYYGYRIAPKNKTNSKYKIHYHGIWLNGAPEGYGLLSDEFNYSYRGYWKNGYPNGKGIAYYPDGKIEYGIWQNGYLGHGKTIPCKRKGGSLKFFIEEGKAPVFSPVNRIHNDGRCFYSWVEDYGQYHLNLYTFTKRRRFRWNDIAYCVFSLGYDDKLSNFLNEIRDLKTIYTDSSIQDALQNVPSISSFLFEHDNSSLFSDLSIGYYENYPELCFIWKYEVDNYEERDSALCAKEFIYEKVRFIQTFLQELHSFRLNTKLLVVDEDKKASLIRRAKFKSFLKNAAIITAKVAVKAAVVAAAAYVGTSIGMPDDGNFALDSGDSFDGDDFDFSGFDYSDMDYVDTSDLPVELSDINVDYDSQLSEIAHSYGYNDNNPSFMGNKHIGNDIYLDQNQTIRLDRAGGGGSDSFDVYVKSGTNSKYILDGHTPIRLTGQQVKINGIKYVLG